MKKPERIRIGNEMIYNGKAIVAFVDILGFSKFIEENWNNENVNPLKIILGIKEKVPLVVAEDDYFLEGNDEEFKAHITVKGRIQTMSDSFILACPINPIDHINMFFGLSIVVKSILQIWYELIRNGFTIRGGISFGDVFWNDKEIIGPSFIEAYTMESTIASTSRVILSSSCNRLLLTLKKSEFKNQFSTMFFSDVDGYTIVNPCNLPNFYDNKAEIIKILKALREKQKVFTVREKYTALINYLITGKGNLELLEY